MIGYCKEGQYLAFVYEYMPEGTLKEHIDGNLVIQPACTSHRSTFEIAKF